MANKQVRDILGDIRRFHGRLSQLYAQLAERSGGERLKLLLDYMSRHEQHIEEYLGRYDHEGLKKLLDHWIECRAVDSLCNLDQIKLDPEMTPEQLITTALNLDSQLIKFYEHLASLAKDADTQELFNALLKHERREEVKLARDAIEFVQDD